MTATIIFARLNSSRLPGKALLKIGEAELIKQVYERTVRINVDEIIIATSVEKTDDPLIEFLEREDIKYFRGDLDNVALRTTQCIHHFGIDTFIRVNGDSPLFPVTELNSALSLFRDKQYDFITNLLPRSYPYGYSMEVFNSETFCSHYPNFNTFQREHITSYFYSNKEKFKYMNINNPAGNYSDEFFLTVDDMDSYSFMNEFFCEFTDASTFELDEILEKYKLIKNRQKAAC